MPVLLRIPLPLVVIALVAAVAATEADAAKPRAEARLPDVSAAPHSNPGNFRGFYSFNQRRRREYETGFTQKKHARLKAALPRTLEQAAAAQNIERLEPVADPPLAQMLAPGFSVRELPVRLTNINNLRYRSDGKLYALGYNGDIWLLRDTSGDGLPDAAEQFFQNQGRLRGPIGMAVIPAGHAALGGASEAGRAARGVVVASKGKVSAIVDSDGDDKADAERVIATGWKEIPQNVDAVGVAIDPNDGAIYFGLGTAAYNNAYLLDAAGRSAYRLESQRGSIQKIEPNLSERETVCTGVRFTIGMAFNEHGDLFATDQEGATWLPNGNPFDELLHIQPGRHYGFPPRHPRHLPRVFDEPSLFDYGPQHQSTCGLVFNLPSEHHRGNGRGVFGPEHWRGDALVCGQSRGKLYRTRLVRTRGGQYVAQNYLIGCLSMLTVDGCLSPRGDLIVACHSGPPDWGTGPAGKGKLLAIRYENQSLPQPLTVWTAGRQEVRIAFDRPLDPARLRQLAQRSRITYGEYVAAGDRFESIRPGYAVTQMQQSKPRYRLPIYSASITPDRKTLILATAPHPSAVQYALTLPGLGRKTDAEQEGVEPQHPQIDLAYSLDGVWARWTPDDERQRGWSGWLPHLDLDVARAFAPAGNAERDRFWEVIEQPGSLTLTTQLDSHGLFLPAVQPGSTLDYDRRQDTWIARRGFQFSSRRPFTVDLPRSSTHLRSENADGSHRTTVELSLDAPRATPISLQLKTGGPISLRAEWSVATADGKHRSGPLALHRMVLPWAKLEPEASAPARPRPDPELAGASWGRGRRVFMDEKTGCSKCHVHHGSGGRIGPDLSNLVHRDYASVLRDITAPSFAINPDFITYNAAMRDGRILAGTVRSEGDRLLIGDRDAKVTTVSRRDVERLRPGSLSVMPEGLLKQLDARQKRDLMAFLLQEPPRMPRDGSLPPPPPRSRSEVAAVLEGSAIPPADSLQPLNVLLVAGKKDHGPGEHDYPAWLSVWSELMAAAHKVTVQTAMEWPTPEQIQAADTMVFYQKGSWNAERAKAIDAHLAKGGGLAYIHWAVEGGADAASFARRIGLASHAQKLKYRHGPLELVFPGADHPIARNFQRVRFYDESYWRMQGDPSRIRVLATGVEQGEPRPLFWTFEPGRGRVFVSILGHYSWTFDDPLFRILLLRGIAWSARREVDRFNELATLGFPGDRLQATGSRTPCPFVVP